MWPKRERAKYELYDGDALIGVFTAAEIADRTDAPIDSVRSAKNGGYKLRRRYVVKDIGPKPKLEAQKFDAYRDGRYVSTGTAIELAKKCGLAVSTVYTSARDGVVVKGIWRFREAKKRDPKQMSLTQIAREARAHGMSYGKYVRYLEGQEGG